MGDTQTQDKQSRNLNMYESMKLNNKIIKNIVSDIDYYSDDRIKRDGYTKRDFYLAAETNNVAELVRISKFFMRASGIYEKLCIYLSKIFRYDFYVYPTYIHEEAAVDNILYEDFRSCLTFLERSNLKQIFNDISLKVVTEGCYYGYIVSDVRDKLILQELPAAYCRSRFKQGNFPVVEFNMAYFDTEFPNPVYREKMLQIFPKDFAEGYQLYKQNKLANADTAPYYEIGWYPLEVGKAVKFNLNNSDIPTLVNVIPALLDLDEANDINKKRTLQQLVKIVIQKLPLTPDGELIFDMDEAADIHLNAVNMLKRALGIDVLTTFADVQVASTADKNTTVTADELAKMERQVFNQSGVAQNLFNSDGNLSLEKSVANDAGSMRDLLLQFQTFLDHIIVTYKFNKTNKYDFRVKLLETTMYNYIELSGKYKELVATGYSKMLPMIALGHSQLEILDTLTFENKILKLYEVMIPPITSNTINGEQLLGNNNLNNSNKNDKKLEDNKILGEEKNKGGRPKKEESELSDKSIKNINAQ